MNRFKFYFFIINRKQLASKILLQIIQLLKVLNFLTFYQLSKIEAILQGPDRKDMQRFAAAANVVLTSEKVRGKTPTSTACSMQ